MNTQVSKELLEKLCLRLTEEMGLHYTEERFEELERRLKPCALKFRIPEGEGFLPWLVNQPWNSQHIEVLAHHLTIGETYFFRDSKLWEFFENELIVELSDRLSITRRQATIWSAAACTGEEALTIAMCIERSGTNLLRENVAIYGTDINTNFLSIARQGLYTKWSLRSTPASVVSQYFDEHINQRYCVKPEILQKVNFSYHNLVSTLPPSFLSANQKADVIFCRNMLMYFSEENARNLIRRLSDFLTDDGYLLLSPNDVWFASDLGLDKIVKPGVIVFKKTKKTPRIASVTVTSIPSMISDTASESGPKIPLPTQLIERKYQASAAPLPATSPSYFAATTAKANAITDPQIKDEQLAIARLINDGSYLAAIKRIEAQFEADNFEEILFHQIVECSANLGHLDAAIDWLTQATERHPLSPNFYYLKANFLQEVENLTDAIACLKQAIFLKPDFIMAHFALLCLYRKLKQDTEANIYTRNLIRQLQNFPSEAIVPDSDGLSAGTLKQILDSWGR